MKVQTVGELLKALPEGVEVDEVLMSNLAVLGLQLDGMVNIIGAKDGKLLSENTDKGREEVTKRMVEKMNGRRAFDRLA